MKKPGLPYANASSGSAAIAEIEKILRRFGCANFGTMTDWERGVLMLQFTYRERRVSLEASWRGYAELWLKENPYGHLRRKTKHEYEMEARKRGEMAVPSILRDWVKGQITAVEIGLMPFEHAFMPHMLMNDGTRLIDRAVLLLEGPAKAGATQ